MTVRAIGDLFSVEGRTACVTGATSGLGRRAADVLVACGCRVVGVARRHATLEAWAGRSGANAGYVAADVGDIDTLGSVAQRVAGIFGTPDILINAAGLNTRQPAGEVSVQGWQSTIDLNLSAPFFLAQAFAGAMRKKGWGRIVNFASLQSYRAFPGGIAYGASKGGVAQLTRAMAEAWSADGINANAIGPGFFRTELTAPVFADPDRAARNAAQTCIGRNGEPEDIDGLILFLSSDASAYVTGQVLMIDGGFTAK